MEGSVSNAKLCPRYAISDVKFYQPACKNNIGDNVSLTVNFGDLFSTSDEPAVSA